MKQSVIEIKYGQDNVEIINQAILKGLPWKDLTIDKIVEFFENNVIVTKITDFRSLDQTFSIIGAHGFGYWKYNVSFTTRMLDPRNIVVPAGWVAFKPAVSESAIPTIQISRIIEEAEMEHKLWETSAAVLEDFSVRIRKTREQSSTIYSKDYMFRFNFDQAEVKHGQINKEDVVQS